MSMTLAEKILQCIQVLPESKQLEVLDFIEYLRSKTESQENKDWSKFSLSSAMREMEDEQTPYLLNDLKESFT